MTLLQRDREKFAEGKAEGIAEGKNEELVSLVKDGLLELAVAAKRAGMTVEEFEKIMK